VGQQRAEETIRVRDNELPGFDQQHDFSAS
jgi:hypothetical protein